MAASASAAAWAWRKVTLDSVGNRRRRGHPHSEVARDCLLNPNFPVAREPAREIEMTSRSRVVSCAVRRG
jgi:hypothetical protein